MLTYYQKKAEAKLQVPRLFTRTVAMPGCALCVYRCVSIHLIALWYRIVSHPQEAEAKVASDNKGLVLGADDDEEEDTPESIMRAAMSGEESQVSAGRVRHIALV